MKISFNKKSLLSLILSIALVLTFFYQPHPVYAHETSSDHLATHVHEVEDIEDYLASYKLDTQVSNTEQETIVSKVVSGKSKVSKFFNTKSENELESEFNSLEASMILDKETLQIRLITNEISASTGEEYREYDVVINALGDNGDIQATFTDTETLEVYEVNQDELQASLVFLVPIGVVIGEILLAHLLAMALAVTIGGIAYAAWHEIANTLRNDPTYDHYAAELYLGKVYIGPALSFTQAWQRLSPNSGLRDGIGNVFSTSSAKALAVATTAGGGKLAVGPELTCNQLPGFLYFTHYHTHDRRGGHSFF